MQRYLCIITFGKLPTKGPKTYQSTIPLAKKTSDSFIKILKKLPLFALS